MSRSGWPLWFRFKKWCGGKLAERVVCLGIVTCKRVHLSNLAVGYFYSAQPFRSLHDQASCRSSRMAQSLSLMAKSLPIRSRPRRPLDLHQRVNRSGAGQADCHSLRPRTSPGVAARGVPYPHRIYRRLLLVRNGEEWKRLNQSLSGHIWSPLALASINTRF